MADIENSPIFVIGANGSGKTTIARIIARAGGWYHWEEPNVLLRTGHAYRHIDFAKAVDAKPWVKRFWQHTVAAKMKESSHSRVVIDSPFSALYVPYLLSIYPDARFVLVVRKPNSAFHIRLPTTQNTDWVYDVSRKETRHRIIAQIQQISLREYPAYFLKFFSIRTQKRIFGYKPWFGPRYPGWEIDQRSQRSEVDIRLKQWKYVYNMALESLESTKQTSWCMIRAEELPVSPGQVLEVVGHRCDLRAEKLLSIYQAVAAKQAWSVCKEYSEDLDHLARDDRSVQELLVRLGYSLSSDSC